jgi:tetratricopeptide (TPR) repeat protein
VRHARPVSSERVETQLGAYTLESPLGQGGMGTVWLARRSDGRYEGRAAVKLLNAALVGRPAEQRFMREGSVLARLRHPHVAQLTDAGISPRGQPYLVLEYVEGERIDAFAERRGLGIEARVRLFLDVVSAVSHAHRHLIVHRDLKPSNILVTADGTVKLLDFGIAALLGDGEGEMTRELGSMLTPEYAAPEQLLGQQVTTATDVFALGLVLFVLLVGEHPFARTGTTPAALARATLSQDAPRLSTLMRDARSSQLLRGDLESIAAKALKKEPAERYAGADALAQDLESFLAHQPVSARPDSVSYRLGKFVRRNRGTVAAGAATTLVLVAAAIVTTIGMIEAKRQRDEAVFQAKRAEYQAGFADQILSEVGRDGQPITVRGLIGKAVEVLDRNYGQDPEFAVGLLVNVSGRYMDLGDTRSEHASLVKAEALARKLGDPDLIAHVQCNTVETELALGEPERANERMRDGLANLARVTDAGPLRRTECGLAHARLLWSQNQLARAIEESTAVGHLMVENGLESHITFRTIVSMTIVMLNEADRSREALEWSQRDVGVLQRSGGDNTLHMGNAMHLRAQIYWLSGDARSAFETQRDIMQRIVKEAGADALVPQQMFALGVYQARVEENEEAFTWLDRAVASAREAGNRPAEIGALAARAEAGLLLGKLDRVLPDIEAAEAQASSNPDAHRNALRLAKLARGELLLVRGHADEALRIAEELLAEIGYPDRSARRMVAMLGLRARAQVALGSKHALALARDALAVAEQRAIDVEKSADAGVALVTLARAQRAAGETGAARSSAQRAVRVLSRSLRPEHSEVRAAVQLVGEDTGHASAHVSH